MQCTLCVCIYIYIYIVVDSSVQHREMRLDLIAMKNEIHKADLNQANANFARMLELQAVLYMLCVYMYIHV